MVSLKRQTHSLAVVIILTTQLLESETKTVPPLSTTTPLGLLNCATVAGPSTNPLLVPAKVVTPSELNNILRIRWLP